MRRSDHHPLRVIDGGAADADADWRKGGGIIDDPADEGDEIAHRERLLDGGHVAGLPGIESNEDRDKIILGERTIATLDLPARGLDYGRLLEDLVGRDDGGGGGRPLISDVMDSMDVLLDLLVPKEGAILGSRLLVGRGIPHDSSSAGHKHI